MKSSDGTCVCGSYIKIEGKRDVNIPPGVKACRQHISAMERQVIKVDLSSVSLPPSSNCANYIEVRNGNSGDSVLILKYCGEGSSTVVSSSPDVIVSWHFTSTQSVSPGAVLLSVQPPRCKCRWNVFILKFLYFKFGTCVLRALVHLSAFLL